MRGTTEMKKIPYVTFLVLILSAQSAFAKPTVLSSLKPLSLIAQEIGGDNVEIDTLLPVTASHHNHPLKASDYARLQKADVVLWIGPVLESFLAKPLTSITPNRILTIYHLEGLFWPSQDDHAGDEHGYDRDPHLWLDPRNAIILGRAISQKLIAIDPSNKQQYETNERHFTANMQNLDEKIKNQLKPYSKQGFAVYHEGFSHFVQHYQLNQLDYLMFTPEQKPGAKHMHQMREKISKNGVCLFLEPYNDAPSALALAKEYHLKLSTLDALGAQNIHSYAQLLETMANAFSACLKSR